MARLFDDGSSQYLQNLNAPVNDWPVTLACWLYIDDLTNEQVFLSICESGVASNRVWLGVQAAAANKIRAYADNVAAYSSIAPSLNTWHHACAVFAASNSRTAYLDGGNSNSNSDTSTCTVANWDNVAIGMARDSTPSMPTSGRLCEAAVWNVALTAAEAGILAKGYSPLLVRPQGLVCYWPLIRDTDQDVVGGYDLTAANNPTVAVHVPKTRYPVAPFTPVPSAIAAILGERGILRGVGRGVGRGL